MEDSLVSKTSIHVEGVSEHYRTLRLRGKVAICSIYLYVVVYSGILGLELVLVYNVDLVQSMKTLLSRHMDRLADVLLAQVTRDGRHGIANL